MYHYDDNDRYMIWNKITSKRRVIFLVSVVSFWQSFPESFLNGELKTYSLFVAESRNHREIKLSTMYSRVSVLYSSTLKANFTMALEEGTAESCIEFGCAVQISHNNQRIGY